MEKLPLASQHCWFCSRPISDWILAIIFPSVWLSIPKPKTLGNSKFLLLLLWTSSGCLGTSLIHEAIQPDPVKAIKQVSSLLDFHVSAWQAAALPSLWSPPPHGSIKANFDVAVRGDFAVAAAVLVILWEYYSCSHS
jgi:hypothetical protein